MEVVEQQSVGKDDDPEMNGNLGDAQPQSAQGDRVDGSDERHACSSTQAATVSEDQMSVETGELEKAQRHTRVPAAQARIVHITQMLSEFTAKVKEFSQLQDVQEGMKPTAEHTIKRVEKKLATAQTGVLKLQSDLVAAQDDLQKKQDIEASKTHKVNCKAAEAALPAELKKEWSREGFKFVIQARVDALADLDNKIDVNDTVWQEKVVASV